MREAYELPQFFHRRAKLLSTPRIQFDQWWYLVITKAPEILLRSILPASGCLSASVRECLSVNRHNGCPALPFVPKNNMAASLTFFNESCALERGQNFRRPRRWEARQVSAGRFT
jgi:hypothetical protein